MLLACGVQYVINILEKWFPLEGERAHALYLGGFKIQIERGGGGGGGTEQHQQILTFSTDYGL